MTRKPHLGNDTWSSLGTFTFKKGKSYEVILSNENTEGYVVADAIQVVGLTPEFILYSCITTLPIS